MQFFLQTDASRTQHTGEYQAKLHSPTKNSDMVSQRVVTVHAPGPCLLISVVLISVQYACCTEKSLTHSAQSCTVGQQRHTSQVVCARAPKFLLVALLLYEFFLQTLSTKTTDSTRQNEQGLRERNDHAAAAMVSA